MENNKNNYLNINIISITFSDMDNLFNQFKPPDVPKPDKVVQERIREFCGGNSSRIYKVFFLKDPIPEKDWRKINRGGIIEFTPPVINGECQRVVDFISKLVWNIVSLQNDSWKSWLFLVLDGRVIEWRHMQLNLTPARSYNILPS